MLPEFKPKARAKINLPPPSGYRQLVPAFQPPTLAPDAQRRERSRLLLWFGVALGLHAALLLALFLTPPLRLKASYAPDRWVHIMPSGTDCLAARTEGKKTHHVRSRQR
jgi:hypothetical protein